MPSVRIRRNTYIPLEDAGQSSSEPRSLATIFAPFSSPTEIDSNNDRTHATAPPPTLAITSEPQTRPRSRPRASSRVDRHCQSRLVATRSRGDQMLGDQRLSLRLQRTSSYAPSRTQEGTEIIEGGQVDVPVQSDGEPGLIGSALSLQSAGQPSEQLDEDHHRDDVVEHLDCIDPQVATVSNLTNAANAIIFPPLSFYCRKPTVVLLDSAEPRSDTEMGKGFEDPLDRHVDDILRKPSKLKRTMQGVWLYVKTPLGFLAAIYGFLVVFWGAAIVLFLTKIINLHNANTQGLWVEISSQIENGLFTVTGIGLIPSRVWDTYVIFKIWRYKRRTKLLRTRAGLPQLYDVDDLPDPAYDPNYVHVLTDGEQLDLHKLQEKLQQHQTWYRPHGTETHRAFPITTALLICCFNDGNSIFQIMLCGVMWGLNRFERPPWTTGTLIPCAFLCGICSAIFIWRGGQKTKREKEVQEKLRKVLAMKGPYVNDSAPVDIGIAVQEQTKVHEGSTTGEHTRVNEKGSEKEDSTTQGIVPDKIEIHDCMTVPSSV